MQLVFKNKSWHELILKWAPAIILALTAAVYAKAVFFQFVVYDDDSFITNNPVIKDGSLEGIKSVFTSLSSGKFNPFTTISYIIEYKLFGFNPVPYHVDNIILHLLSTLLVFKISEQLSNNRITACVVSVLFGIHPMHVEEVAWAAERKDTLYVFFFLFALSLYLRYLDSGLKLKYYYISLLLFMASLLAKSEAMTLPLILFAVDLYKGRRLNKRAIAEKIPFLVCSVIIAFLSQISQHEAGNFNGSMAGFGFINRIFLSVWVAAFYPVKLFAPFHLSAIYYYPDVRNGVLPWYYYASLPVLLLIVLFVVKLPSLSGRRSDFIRKQILFGVSFFIITISVMPQILFRGPSITPDRYSYIPYIGLFFVIGQWIAQVGLTTRKTLTMTVLGLFLLMLTITAWLRLDVWRDGESLVADAIAKNSGIADLLYMYYLRGTSRDKEGRFSDAVQDFSYAIRQHPGMYEAYSNRGATYLYLTRQGLVHFFRPKLGNSK